MDKKEKMEKFNEFFDSLVSLLSETYTEVASCNQDFTVKPRNGAGLNPIHKIVFH